MSDRLLFCVFSFNRGKFLENCVESIEACVPGAEVVVFDDDSNDDYTCEVLSSLSQRGVSVVQPGNQSRHKLGGLYGNMQSALEYGRYHDLVCFIQDDMQVVRSVKSEEIADVNELFANRREIAFLHPCFLKGQNRKRDEAAMVYDSSLGVFRRRSTDQSAGQYFSDILLMRPSRLLEKGWQFRSSEPANDLQARENFETIAYMFTPFAMWLPDVPAYRGKIKTVALKLAEKRRKCGFFPYEMLDENQIDHLQSRPKDVLPFAEDFLTCVKQDLGKPWRYYPMQDSRLLKKLNSLELALRKLF